MLTDLLASDPTTTADVLAHLAEQPLTAAASRALAAHPNFPSGAALPVPRQRHGDLHAALSNPSIPTCRRQGFIDATEGGDLTWNVLHHADLTPGELTGIFDGLSDNDHIHDLTALALNPRTPTHLIPEIVARTPSSSYGVLADVTFLRHRIPGRTHLTLWNHPEPLSTYAAQLLRNDHGHDSFWWDSTIAHFPHPDITDAGLKVAARTTNRRLAAVICRSIARNSHATPAHRERAAILVPDTIAHFADTADDTFLRAHITRTHVSRGWGNPNVTDATLRAMLTYIRATPTTRYVLADIALHPGASSGVRRDAAAAAAFAWLTALTTHLDTGAPGAALDVPYADLVAANGRSPHALPWIRAAWAHHHRDHPATLTYTRALLALTAAGFTGTLRELATTARTITT